MAAIVLNNSEHFDLFMALNKASEHMLGGVWSVADGFFEFEVDVDVDLRPWGIVLKAGPYQTQVGSNGDTTPVPCFLNGEEIGETTISFPDAGVVDPGDAVDRVTFDVLNDVYDADRHRIDLTDGRPLTYFDLLLWLAIQDADSTGDTSKGDSFFRIAYDAERDEIIGIADLVNDNPAPLAAPEDADPLPLPKMEQIRPYRHYAPNAKTTEVLTKPVLFDGIATLDVGKRKGQLSIDFGLEWSDGEEPANIDISQPIDREDVRVIASVVTLKNAGNVTVSPFQIAETMGYGMPTVELQEEIHERVMKLRNIDGRIDWTAQARRYGINNPETGKPFEHAEITGHLIDCAVFDGTDTDGNRYIRYQLLSDPITYQHAHQIGQVIDYPQRLLGVKPISEAGVRRKRVTREQTQVADSVLWFVYSLLNPKNSLGESIRYETLFERAGVDATHYKRRQRLVVFVNDYLRALQAEGVIRGFEVYAPGTSHKPVSVRVIVPKRRNVSRRGRR